MRKPCPICGHPLTKTREKSELLDGFGRPREIDEYWCIVCQDYIYEEDFLYNTEEDEEKSNDGT